MINKFGPYSLDTDRRRLLRNNQLVRLRTKVLDVLLLLVQRNGSIVTKEDLMREIWPDQFIEESNIAVSISILRKALGENHNSRELIETISGRGYRFVGKVVEVRDESAGLEGRGRDGVRTRASDRFGDVRSIAVLPLVTKSDDPDVESLSAGISESIINRLSKLQGIRVTAWNTVSHFKGKEIDPHKLGHDLNTDAVLVGRLLLMKEYLTINVEVVDLADGAQLWSASMSRSLSDVSKVQEEIAQEIVDGLKLELTKEEAD